MKNPLVVAIIFISIFNLGLFSYKLSQRKGPVPPPVLETPMVQEPVVPIEPEQPKEETKPELVPEFVDVPVHRQMSEKSIYADILSHSQQAPFGDAHGRATNAHETAHGIHSEVRNAHMKQGSRRVNAFYALDGKAVVVEEPNMRKSAVNAFVPPSLRSYRYSLYLGGQSAWDDTPLYLCDEWNAYILGGMTNVDDVKNNRYKGGWTDGVSGCLDFSIYTFALCMAIEKHDPEYWANNKQFRAFVIWNLKRAEQTYLEGSKMSQFKWDKQDSLYKSLLNDPAAESMRKFVEEHLEGVFVRNKEVLQVQYYESFQQQEAPQSFEKGLR